MNPKLLWLAVFTLAGCGSDPKNVPSTSHVASVELDAPPNLRKEVDALTLRIVESIRQRDAAKLRGLSTANVDVKERVAYLHNRLGKGAPKFVHLEESADQNTITAKYLLDLAQEGNPPVYAHELRVSYRKVAGTLKLTAITTRGW